MGEGAVLFQRTQMVRGGVALVAGEVVTRVGRVLDSHQPVASHLGYHGGGRDGQAKCVAMDDCLLRDVELG